MGFLKQEFVRFEPFTSEVNACFFSENNVIDRCQIHYKFLSQETRFLIKCSIKLVGRVLSGYITTRLVVLNPDKTLQTVY